MHRPRRASGEQRLQRHRLHAVGQPVALRPRIDDIERAKSVIAIVIDGVSRGASARLNSTPMRRPPLNSSRSSSAPACAAQKQASSGCASRSICSSAKPSQLAPERKCASSSVSDATGINACSNPLSRK